MHVVLVCLSTDVSGPRSRPTELPTSDSTDEHVYYGS